MRPRKEIIDKPEDASFVLLHRRLAGFPFHWHYHPEMELTLIVRGKGQRFVGDHIADFDTGDLVLLGPNLPHTWSSDPRDGAVRGTHEAVVVFFQPAWWGQAFLENPECRGLSRLLKGAARGFQFSGSAAKRAARRLRALPRLEGLDAFTALLHVLDELSEGEGTALASEGYVPTPGAQTRIDRACRTIHDHVADPLSVGEAAERANMSVSAFSRFFKRNTGRTYVEYINEVRIARAAALLTETDQRVVDICFASGFQNLSHFNRMFRRLKQTTPRAYRQSFR